VNTLQFRFLGPLEVCFGDRRLSKPATLKSQSLLAYLVLHRAQPQPRERLAGMFWGERPERKARHSLATALWRIRRCLPDETLILANSHTVWLDPQSDLWLDVEAFEAWASRDDAASLESAAALYRGDFLDGFYDDWIISERYRLEALFLEALARLMVGHELVGEHQAALATALRLLNHDPLREDGHRLAMRAYCRLGQRNAALEQYDRCREIVLEELGAEPMVETSELYQAILEGRFEVGPVSEMLSVEMPAIGTPGRSPLDVIAPVRLVGRERELAFLQQCWQAAQMGQGGLVLISGEAGVGKTRLVEAFADHMRWQGARVLWGRCYAFERLLPYQPIAEALRAVLEALTAAELASLSAWTIAEVARLVPQALECPVPSEDRPERSRRADPERGRRVERRVELEVPDAADLGEERARLFEGVTRFLTELSSHGALLIVLEDLHWATESTLGLIHYLARHLAGHPVLTVGTWRSEEVGLEHPLFDLRRRLTREGLVKPLRLSRLSPEAIEAMVAEMSGAGEAVAPLARRLYQETEGNPFYLMEIVKALFETGAAHLEEGAWRGDFARISRREIPLPVSVSEAIQARANRLEEDALDALRLAAVLGREFDFDLLSAAWGRGEEATLEALDHLLRHRLIDEGTGALGRDYVFTHHKIQEAVYAGMSRRSRQHAHARVGATMESLCGHKAKEVAGELAFHFHHGSQLDRRLMDRAITYLLLAGDRARMLYAHQEAIDHYQQALALLKEQGEYERAGRTLMKLGLAYHTAFDFQQAREAYEEGFTLWQRAGETEPAITPAPVPHALRAAWQAVQTLDPAMADDLFSVGVIHQLFSGLVEWTIEMGVVPDVARSWEVLEGGRKYVFHLRDDVRWSDGTPVTAGDFEYAWKRVLDPATMAPTSYLLYDIKGAKAFHRGDASDPGQIGVRAPDERTLTVELEAPTGYFLHLLRHTKTYPVPRHVVEADGAGWTGVGVIITNGPFRLETWHRGGEVMLLSRNPWYHGRFKGNVQRVELSLLADPSAQVEMYEDDRLDILPLGRLPLPERARAQQRHVGEYVLGTEPATQYIAFDVSRPPFDDLRVRRAFALATDRETLADVTLRGCYAPGTGGFVPPGIPGHSPGIGLPYDPQQARQLLSQAGYPGGNGFPVVEWVVSNARSPYAEYLQTQWREDLGVELTWEAMELTAFLDRLCREPPEPPNLHVVGWSADYPDPDIFLRVGFPWENTRWRNAGYERLVEEARHLTDHEERMRLYGRADRIAIEEAAIVPLTYDRWPLLVKPWVRKFRASDTRRWFCKDVIIEPH
jgi:ABC-type oligopeptide transport system substrate-binding subunit/DNA-binding SARP family transcriptional activator